MPDYKNIIRNADLEKLKKLRENAEKRIELVSGKQKQDAQEVIKLIVSEFIYREKVQLKEDSDKILEIMSIAEGMDKVERIVEAFRIHPPTDSERNALVAVAQNEGKSTKFIANSLGYKDIGGLNGVFGKMCSFRAPYLGIPPDSEKRSGDKFFSGLLVDLKEVNDTNDGRPYHEWYYKPEATEALKVLRVI